MRFRQVLSRFVSELDMSARHHALCHGEKSSDVVSVVGFAITPRERRYHLRWHLAAKDVRAGPDNRPGAQHCPDAGFRVVGFVDDDPALVGKSLINPSVIGLTSELGALVRRESIDRIVVAIGDARVRLATASSDAQLRAAP